MSAVLPRGGDEGAVDVNGIKCGHPRQILVVRARSRGWRRNGPRRRAKCGCYAKTVRATPRKRSPRRPGAGPSEYPSPRRSGRCSPRTPQGSPPHHPRMAGGSGHCSCAVAGGSGHMQLRCGERSARRSCATTGDGALDQQPGDGGIGGAGVMRTPGMHDDPGVVRVAGYRGGQDPRAHGARRDRSRCAQHPRHHRCYIRDYAGAADPVGSLLLLDDVHRARIAERTDAELGEAGEHHHRRLGGGDQVAERNSDVARLMPYSRASAVSSSPEPAR